MRVALLALLAACGGGVGTHSGIDPDRALTQLDTEELRTLCKEHIEAPAAVLSADEQIRWACYGSAIALHKAFPLVFPDCEASAQKCIASPDDGDEPVDECDFESIADADLPACAAQVTVGQYERCTDELGQSLRAAVAGLSCSTDVDAILMPEACADIQARCPGLVED